MTDINIPSVPTIPTIPTISTAEAADVLGVSVSTVVRRCRSGEIPAIAENGSWRVIASAVNAEPAPDDTPGADLLAERLAGLPLLLTVDQTASLIGERPHEIRQMCRQGAIPCRRCGERRWRIPLPSLVDWLTGHDRES